MNLKQLTRTALCWLLLVVLLAAKAIGADVLFYVGTSGQTLYVRVNEAGTLNACALTEGSSGLEGNYIATEANLVSAGVNTASTGNGFPFTVRSGTPSTTATDAIVAYGTLPWSGSAELITPTDARAWAGTATASDDIALLSQLSASNFASSFITSSSFAAGAINAAAVATDAIGAAELAADAATEIATAVGSASGVSAYLVDPDHTWRFDTPSQVTAPNSLTENIGFVGLLQMDFTQPLPALGSIASISSTAVADVGGATEPTISTSALSADKKKVVLTVNASAATASTYTFTVTIVTTDSQTIVRKGRLVVQ